MPVGRINAVGARSKCGPPIYCWRLWHSHSALNYALVLAEHRKFSGKSRIAPRQRGLCLRPLPGRRNDALREQRHRALAGIRATARTPTGVNTDHPATRRDHLTSKRQQHSKCYMKLAITTRLVGASRGLLSGYVIRFTAVAFVVCGHSGGRPVGWQADR